MKFVFLHLHLTLAKTPLSKKRSKSHPKAVFPETTKILHTQEAAGICIYIYSYIYIVIYKYITYPTSPSHRNLQASTGPSPRSQRFGPHPLGWQSTGWVLLGEFSTPGGRWGAMTRRKSLDLWQICCGYVK